MGKISVLSTRQRFAIKGEIEWKKGISQVEYICFSRVVKIFQIHF